jgi:dephospho-CoA kinase
MYIMNFDVLAVSGSIGSGKSTLSKELSKVRNCKYASFGDYVRKKAVTMGYVEASRTQLQKVGEVLVENGIRDFCLSVLQDSMWQLGEELIVDGVRHLEALETLKEIIFPQNLFLVYITLDEKTRVERLTSRDKDKNSHNSEKHSTEIQVPDILRTRADILINGSETVANNIDKIIQLLKSKE